jgi:ATP-citrate lyase beta-subunit
MARVKISEYKAKQLLLGDSYKGVQLRSDAKMVIPKGELVAKVDQGVKKRMKQGLVAVKKPAAEMLKAIKGWEKKGFSQFVLEPFLPHAQEEEQYFSLERVRGGVRLLHAVDGGIDIEEHPEKVHEYLMQSDEDVKRVAREAKLPADFLARIYEAFQRNHFAFLEINPLVVQGKDAHLLDAAVLVDSAAEFFVRGAWTEEDIIKARAKHSAEGRVEALAATTPAALKLNVLNPDGSLFLLLSGGGGSIVIADEAQLRGVGAAIANYGEYSGGPTREETYLYSKEVIALMLDSAAMKKALVIAGGVANFTDVRKTFLGIIDALDESKDALREAGAKVFVRRGGPHEKEGLALMRDFLERHGLLGAVYGSDTVITKAIEDAIEFVV